MSAPSARQSQTLHEIHRVVRRLRGFPPDHARHAKKHPVAYAPAVAGSTRAPDLPDVPTVGQSGVKALEGYDATFGYLVMALRDTPQEVVKIWEAALARVYVLPEFQQTMAGLGVRGE
ncbi:hypothetical protein LMG3412_00297 [Achromobacter deleyi]|nr:hypothetical protein LMG3412_00297 [Achromobacter deleyi]